MRIQNIFLSMFALATFVACSNDDDTSNPEVQEEVSPLVGSWQIASQAGALAVGEAAGNYGWWSLSAEDVGARACLLDDTYTFNADGSFENQMGDATWVEGWQGAEAEGCAAAVAPHDGSNAGTWSADDATITINGRGSFLVLAKVHNTGEDGNPANNTITYNYTLNSAGTELEITISGWLADVPAATWYYKLVKQ